MVLSPNYGGNLVSIDNLQNTMQICPPPDFEVDRPTLVDLFEEWNKKFHSDEDNPRTYSLIFNFNERTKSISEVDGANTGNAIKVYINNSKAENQAFVRMMFDMLENVDEVNYLL